MPPAPGAGRPQLSSDMMCRRRGTTPVDNPNGEEPNEASLALFQSHLNLDSDADNHGDWMRR